MFLTVNCIPTDQVREQDMPPTVPDLMAWFDNAIARDIIDTTSWVTCGPTFATPRGPRRSRPGCGRCCGRRPVRC